jgi:hypothetical protein
MSISGWRQSSKETYGLMILGLGLCRASEQRPSALVVQRVMPLLAILCPSLRFLAPDIRRRHLSWADDSLARCRRIRARSRAHQSLQGQ